MNFSTAGAIPANGRGGRETTLWTEQKEFCHKNLLLYVSKPIERSDLSEVLYKIQPMRFFEEVTELFVSKYKLGK